MSYNNIFADDEGTKLMKNFILEVEQFIFVRTLKSQWNIDMTFSRLYKFFLYFRLAFQVRKTIAKFSFFLSIFFLSLKTSIDYTNLHTEHRSSFLIICSKHKILSPLLFSHDYYIKWIAYDVIR